MRANRKGGALLGEGGFGMVYDSLDDIGKITKVAKHKPSGGSNGSSGNVALQLDDVVFKLVPEAEERSREEDGIRAVYDAVSGNKNAIEDVTCLHPTIRAVTNESGDEFFVLRRFQSTLQDVLFTKIRGNSYKREWEPNTTLTAKDAREIIHNTIASALALLAMMHQSGYIHADVKLDNILARRHSGWHVVLGDYGQVTAISSEEMFIEDGMFFGMCDYMPPFCHGYVWQRTYMQHMNALFVGANNQRSKHPRAGVGIEFFESVLKTYPNIPLEEHRAKKIDLHPLGIVLLQLLERFGSELSQTTSHGMLEFAMQLMVHENENAASLLMSWLDLCVA